MGVVFRFVLRAEVSQAEVEELRMGVALNGVESRVENVLIEGSMRVMKKFGFLWMRVGLSRKSGLDCGCV